MIRRPFLTAAVAAALYATVLVGTASAQLHNVRVTLVTGQVMTLQVEVPDGATATAAQIPPLPAPTQTIEDLGPVQVPTAVPTPQVPVPTATPQLPSLPVPTPSPDNPGTPGTPDTPVTPGGGSDGGQTTDPAAPEKGKQKRPGANTETLKRKVREKEREASGTVDAANPGRNLDGTPTLNNPTFSLSEPGAAPIGVPNFFIDKFRIPPFLLSIYQAAGIQYGIRWEILAAINEIETDYGRNLNISSAGALGWMQFMPATWKMYGVDANRDGKKDPFNPVDAIFAAARYLRAAGGEQDIRKAIFAYNHADWYVDSVLLRARVIGGLPSNLVGSLTGLTQGRFPVATKATYADDLSERDIKRMKAKGNKAVVVESGAQRRGIKIFAKKGAPVIAVNDGRIIGIGTSKRLGRYIKLQDVYGNTYTYAHLGKVAKRYPAPKEKQVSKREIQKELKLPEKDAAPTEAASDSSRARRARAEAGDRPQGRAARQEAGRRVRRQGRQAAPVRQPAAQERGGRRRRPAGIRAHGPHRRRLDLPGLPDPRLRARPLRRAPEDAQAGLPDRGRHDPRPHRQDHAALRAAHAVRDPPGRPRRAADRPEADPRRLEAARVDRHLPRGGQEPVLRLGLRRPVDRPDPADEQGGARRARRQQPAHRDLRLRPARRPDGPGRPARARHARVPRRLRLQADGDLAQVRPLADDRLGQRVRALDRQRGRHRRDQRDPDHRPPGRRLDHRADDPAAADAAGHDEAATRSSR